MRNTQAVVAAWPLLLASLVPAQATKTLPKQADADQTKAAAKSELPKKAPPKQATPKTAAAKAVATAFSNQHVAQLPCRQLGPANMGGRITNFAASKQNPDKWFVASASGGLFKSENRGTTWTALFQDQQTASIGDVAVAPSDDSIVWVGTGEENGRNSVSWGDGVYKSIDGGKTFKHMGLKQSFQIGQVEIHPRNPDIVFVAALGHLWGDNKERGVYRTLDGGETWDHVLALDAKTGCIDVRIELSQPNIVYAAMYERRRNAFDDNDPVVRFGAKSGLYRSVDGGGTWVRMTKGLPSCKWGRTGLTLYPKKPGTLFAIIETERSGWHSGTARQRSGAAPQRNPGYMGVDGIVSPDSGEGAVLTEVIKGTPAEAAGFKDGDVVLKFADTKIQQAQQLYAAIRRRFEGDKVKVQIKRKDKPMDLVLTLGSRFESNQSPGSRQRGTPRNAGARRSSGNRSSGNRGSGNRGSGNRGSGNRRNPRARRGGRLPHGGRLGGQAANRQNRQGEKAYETGGVYRSDDFGVTWKRVNSLTARPFYFSVITVDPNNDQTLYSCGISLYKTVNGGKSFTTINRGIHVDFHDVWVHPKDSDMVVACCDGGLNISYDQGKTWEVPNNLVMAQFYRVGLDNSHPYRVYGGLQDNGTWGGPSRTRFTDGTSIQEWFKIYGGDGFGAAVDPDDPTKVWATSQGGNIGLVDLKTGRTFRVQRGRGPDGGRARFNWDTPFIISPHNPRTLLFAGTYAYRAQAHYTKLSRSVPSKVISGRLGLTAKGTATAIAQSPRDPDWIWVGTDDGALWRTSDGGKTWTELHKKLGLPAPRYVSHIQPSHTRTKRVYVTLDPHRHNDFNTYIFVSEDGGDKWQSITNGMPPRAPCHVILEDPRSYNLLFVGTEFGAHVSLDRGKNWMRLGSKLGTVPVKDLAIQSRESDLVAATHGRGMYVLDIHPLRELTSKIAKADATLLPVQSQTAWQAVGRSRSGHKQWRATKAPLVNVYLCLKDKLKERPSVTIHDLQGRKIATLRGQNQAGLQRLVWNGRRGITEAGGRRRVRRGRMAAPGWYSARFKFNDKVQKQAFELRPDPITKSRPNTHPRSRSN